MGDDFPLAFIAIRLGFRQARRVEDINPFKGQVRGRFALSRLGEGEGFPPEGPAEGPEGKS